MDPKKKTIYFNWLYFQLLDLWVGASEIVAISPESTDDLIFGMRVTKLLFWSWLKIFLHLLSIGCKK